MLVADSQLPERSAGSAGEHAYRGSVVPKSYTRKLASDLRLVITVVEDMARLAQAWQYSDSSVFAIRLAVEEALVNAIAHGNGGKASLHVRVGAKASKERFLAWVEDEGPGFDRAQVPDPTSDVNLSRSGGRGLLLIESYMDDVWWTQNGRRVTMVRRNHPEGVGAIRNAG